MGNALKHPASEHHLKAATHHHAAAHHHFQAAHHHELGEHKEAKEHAAAAHEHNELAHQHTATAPHPFSEVTTRGIGEKNVEVTVANGVLIEPRHSPYMNGPWAGLQRPRGFFVARG
jgi:hypothetical protein